MSLDSQPQPILAVSDLSKSFNGVPALKEVNVAFNGGEVHALCGENGAGKSTLIEILAGNHQADSGLITLAGRAVSLRSPRGALELGIAVIHQEFSLVDELTVAENLMLGHEPRFGFLLDRRSLKQKAQAVLDQYGFALPTRARVGRLPTGQRQLVEIAKALTRDARVLILDEPTAALTRPEAEALFRVLADLKARGMAIIFVSHHLDDVLNMADRITVLRDGRKITTRLASEFPPADLMAAMVGDVVDIRRGQARTSGQVEALRTDHLGGITFEDVSFRIFKGEVLGMTGLAGAGHEELASVLFGARQATSGSMSLKGNVVRFRNPRQAMAAKVASIPADRRRGGLLTTMDIERNLTITQLPTLSRFGVISTNERRQVARTLAQDFEVAFARLSQKATTLSGGNQQKVILARWSSNHPEVIIYNDPTRGIDIKTREAIHRRIEHSAANGAAVLLVTSDIQELRRLADRVLIFRRGRLVAEARTDQLDDHALLAAMIDEPAPTVRDRIAEGNP